MKLIKKISFVLISLSVSFFASCNFSAFPNDGTKAEDRRNKGHVEPDRSTTQKFWKGWAPFIGVQVWGPTEGWGKEPVINLDEGTFGLPEAGLYMPVFGGYDDKGNAIEGGEYDLSKISSFGCDVWAEKEGDVTEMYFSVYHATANEYRFVPKTEPEHISIELTPQQKGTILFLIGMQSGSGENVVHVENVAFYDDEGNQVKSIPFTITGS